MTQKAVPSLDLQRSNRAQSTLMVIGMFIILGICGYAMGEILGLLVAVLLTLFMVAGSSRMSPLVVLRGYKAVEITAEQAPGLTDIFAQLIARAELEHPPKLYYVPSKLLNAFAVGRGADASVAVTDGLLRRLNPRELAAVLAHEVSHIRHNDLFVMGLADAFGRVTAMVGQVGQIMLLVSIPAYFLGYDFPWLGALVLLLAPAANALLQLALSRSREYEADFGAAQLTGDPEGMALALQKIEEVHGPWLDRVLLPGRHEQAPAILRTHPQTHDRLVRLADFAQSGFVNRMAKLRLPDVRPWLTQAPTTIALRAPRWHVSGFWY